MTIGYASAMAERLDVNTRQELITAIAGREGTAEELAVRFNTSIKELRVFTQAHMDEIELAADALQEEAYAEDGDVPIDVVTPTQLSELWISNKFARLKRYELVAEKLFNLTMVTTADATVLRELRFYMTAAANELGQLLHRGAGEQADGDKLSVEIVGVDPESFR